MTDIDELRQRVIDAARAWRQSEDDYDEAGDLVNAIDALNAAEAPDPWEILREAHDRLTDPSRASASNEPMIRTIESALAWHDANDQQDGQ